MTAIFLSPHHDDETLFGAFTLLRERPLVVVVYDGGREREAETDAAMEILGCEVEHWRIPTDEPGLMAATLSRRAAGTVYAPRRMGGGQPEHNEVSRQAQLAHGDRVIHYLTYTDAGKSTNGTPVPYEPEWVPLKLRALACYPSQSGHPSHAPHFIRDQTEYLTV